MARKLENTIEDFDPSLRGVLKDSIDAMDILLEATKNDSAKIPEAIFKEHILPILTNTDGNQSLYKWADVAGNILRPLDVINPATGEILFRVPAPLRSINREFTGEGQNSAFSIINTARLKGKVLPTLGDRFIKEHMTSKVSRIPVDVSTVSAWNAILARYGLKPRFNVDQANDETTDNSDSNGKYTNTRTSINSEIIEFEDI
ncbi:MAG: hypothetical protein IBX57_00175 [Gammaproteobacteria bacterium]|nr:hypothetical protein [Gammaproteobacteria bacterium]